MPAKLMDLRIDPQLVSVDQFAKIIGVGRSKGWQLVMSNAIKTIRVGRRRLVPLDEIHVWKERAMRDAA